ncbi:MAG TPA: alpha/beta hydrolase [Candidatus Methylomirabilis sp.]|nr:alpha/beta hydrolase [Candidatus Methylomirabilis sp.]
MSLGNCGTSQTLAPGRMRTVRGWLGLCLLSLAVGACATPISVKRLDPVVAQQDLTRNALYSGEASSVSRIILNRENLSERFSEKPGAALRALHAEVVSGGRDINYIYALSELSFLYAEGDAPPPEKQAYYLAAATYAYAFLFPPAGTAPPEPYDRRFRDACDLYNRALTAALRSGDGTRIEPHAGVFPLPFGELDVAFDPGQLTWLDRQLAEFVPVVDLGVGGLRNRYRRSGLGAPLAASTLAGAAQEGLGLPPRLKIPVTLFLRLEEPWQQLKSNRLRATLELYVDSDTETVQVGDRRVPLEAEPTAALAYMLSGARVWDYEFSGFLFGDLLRQETPNQLFALEPYRPGRIPVVFVHGTASSPARWAEMFNELQNDPRVRQQYQFWFFIYETGNPILYSALRLRESLETALAKVDPGGQDPALRKMVIVGHSQGGLLTKLMVVELEDKVRAFFPVSIEELQVSPEFRDFLNRIAENHPLPFVRRVIFLATPHRGSYVAGNWLAHQLARFVRLPGQLLRFTGDVLSEDSRLAVTLQGRVGSVYAMTPGSPLVTALGPAPLAPGVIGHSIIAVKGDGPVEGGDDGVVKYASAHIEGVESELVVRSGHSVQSTPEAIEEVRRILLEGAEAR